MRVDLVDLTKKTRKEWLYFANYSVETIRSPNPRGK
jgi:hypothetical protein